MKKTLRIFLLIVILLSLLLPTGSSGVHDVQAGVVTGYSEYYIPGGVDQLFRILQANDDDFNLGNAFGFTGDTCATHGDPDGTGTYGFPGCNEMRNVTTVSVATDHVKIYYDQWENGYTTGATGDEVYTASKGDILTFESSYINVLHYNTKLAADCTTKDVKKNGVVISTGTNCFDGRDRIYVVGGAVSVAQAFWPESLRTVYANAWEIYPVKPEQTEYIVPVGIDLAGAAYNYLDFTNVYVLVESTSDGTAVSIDDPSTAGVEVSTTLNRGDLTQLYSVHTGTKVTSDKPLQVQLITGRSHTGNSSDSRSYTLVPSGLWSTSYFNPVMGGTATDTDIFIYNSNASDLKINYQDGSSSGSIVVPANSTTSFQVLAGHYVPSTSGLYLSAADGTTKFWAIGSYDRGSTGRTGSGPNFNWGFTLIPGDLLTDEYFVSWAPGTVDLTANGSPVFVTPVNNATTIFVDFSPANGTPDATYTLNRSQSQKIFDPDKDNTGMHIWATGPIAVVWGEDSLTASQSNPFIDAGYTVLPLQKAWINVVEETTKTAVPSEIPALAGQVVTFTLQTNSYALLDQVDVSDDLPSGWGYVNNSTIITRPDGSTINGAAANPSIDGQKLTWANVTAGAMQLNKTVAVQFQAQTTAVPSVGAVFNQSSATATKGAETFTSTDQAMVTVKPALDLVAIKTNNVGGVLYRGGSFNWNVQIKNAGSSTSASVANNVALLRDSLPSGPTYPTSATVTRSSTNVTGSLSCPIVNSILTCTTTSAVTIPAGEYFNITFLVTPAASFSGLLVNPLPTGSCQVDPDNRVTEGIESNNACADTLTVLEKADLTVVKTNNVGGQGSAGYPFNWTLTASNAPNTSTAIFTSGQTILTDNLPVGPTYSGVTVTSTSGVSGPLRCQISANDLLCDANGGAVSIPSSESFSATFSVTYSTAGALANPRSGGVCKVNPNSSAMESSTSNNTCSNTVTLTNRADLTATKTNNTRGRVTLGGSFIWTVRVKNVSPSADAIFTSGWLILNDYLPTGATYVIQPVVTSGVTGTGTVRCRLRGNTSQYYIQCDARNGTVNLQSGAYFDAAVTVKPSTVGSLVNPMGGACQADPTPHITEADETNNNCADTVSVQSNPSAALQGFVWSDTTHDNVWGVSEPGIGGVEVELHKGDGTLVESIATSAGNFSFSDLPAGQYYLKVTAPDGYWLVAPNVGGDPARDSDPIPAVPPLKTGQTPIFNLVAGQTRTDIDAGLWSSPTAVTAGDLTVLPEANGVSISWNTSLELKIVGFNIFRQETGSQTGTQLNADMIVAQFPGASQGADYHWFDDTAQPGVKYAYSVEVVNTDGSETLGPISVSRPFSVFLPGISHH